MIKNPEGEDGNGAKGYECDSESHSAAPDVHSGDGRNWPPLGSNRNCRVLTVAEY